MRIYWGGVHAVKKVQKSYQAEYTVWNGSVFEQSDWTYLVEKDIPKT